MCYGIVLININIITFTHNILSMEIDIRNNSNNVPKCIVNVFYFLQLQGANFIPNFNTGVSYLLYYYCYSMLSPVIHIEMSLQIIFRI